VCGGAELACAATLGNDEVRLRAEGDIVIGVQGFVPRTGGPYVLEIFELEIAGEGESCVLPAACDDGLTCVNDLCRRPEDVVCAAETTVAVGQTVSLPVRGVLEDLCGVAGPAEAVAVVVDGVVDGELVLTTDAASVAPVTSCAAFATATCGAAADAIPSSTGEPIHLLLLPAPGDTAVAFTARQRLILPPGSPCNVDDALQRCAAPTECLGLAGATICRVPTIVPVGDACNPADTSDRCDGGTSCLGGPSPRAFTCTTVTEAALGEACVADSTDLVCAGIAACEEGLCTQPPPSTRHAFTGRIIAGQAPTAAGRTRNSCTAENTASRFAFVAFGLENPDNVPATVTATTTGGADTTMSASIPLFDAEAPGAACVASNDDIARNNLNSQITFALPPQTSAEVVVTAFNANATFDFGLTLTSDVAIVALPR
jgi:hypothetical protein